MTDRLDSFLEIVTRRFGGDPRFQMEVYRELRAHLADAVEAARRRGASELESVDEALRHFGDPDEVAEGIVQARLYGYARSRRVIMRSMKVCLWAVGAFCLAAGVALSLPVSWLDCVTTFLGGKPLLWNGPFVHLARGAGITYLGVGAFYVALARRPVRHGLMVPFAGSAAVLFGIVVGISGVSKGLPLFWYVKDSLFALVAGSLIVLLWLRLQAGSEFAATAEAAD